MSTFELCDSGPNKTEFEFHLLILSHFSKEDDFNILQRVHSKSSIFLQLRATLAKGNRLPSICHIPSVIGNSLNEISVVSMICQNVTRKILRSDVRCFGNPKDTIDTKQLKNHVYLLRFGHTSALLLKKK